MSTINNLHYKTLRDFKMRYCAWAPHIERWQPVGKQNIIVYIDDGTCLGYFIDTHQYYIISNGYGTIHRQTIRHNKRCFILRTYFDDSGLTIKEFASACDVSYNQARLYARGESMPKSRILSVVAEVLGFSIEEFDAMTED